MNTAEKIAALEALLVRVQKRAQEPRPARAELSLAPETTAQAEPAQVAPAVVMPAEATPPVSAAHEAESASSNEIESDIDLSSPTTPSLQREEPKKVEPIHVAVPPQVTLAKGTSGSYVAKGGMSEELPDFDLEEEEEGEELAEGEDEIVIEQPAPEASASSQADESEAEEFAIPSRPSVQLRAVSAPAPIEVLRDDEELELDHRPLASALPASTEEAIELHAQQIPPSTVPAAIEPVESPVVLPAAPQFKAPVETELDEPEPTMVSSAISLPEPPVEQAIPLVATPKPAVVEPAKVPSPAIAAPVPSPAVAAPAAKPALVPSPTASAAVPAPVASAKEPVVHEAAPLAASEPVVSVVSEPAAPAAPLSFADLLRRSLALRVK